MKASTVFLPILLKIVRQSMVIVGAWLVEKNIATTDQATTVQTYVLDAVPGLVVMLPGLVWDGWMWLQKFRFIVNIEQALHLPATGMPSAETVIQAATAKTIAQTAVTGGADPDPNKTS